MGRRAPHHLTWWIVEHLGEAGIDVENMITIVRDEHTLIERVEQRLHWQKPFRFFYSHGLLTHRSRILAISDYTHYQTKLGEPALPERRARAVHSKALNPSSPTEADGAIIQA